MTTMTTKIRLMAFALIVATFSVQCTKDDAATPDYPTSIDSYFTAGSYTYEGVEVKYRESSIQPQAGGSTALVVVLHGQNVSGSDNQSQLRSDAMIRIWYNLTNGGNKAILLAPQCTPKRAWDEKSGDVRGATMAEILKALIDDYVVRKTNIDTNRIYLLGYSDGSQPAGAGGVWRMLSDYPDLFAAGMSVAADPDDSILVENLAKTAVLSVKGEMDAHAVALTLESFGDQVRDAGGQLREVILNVRSREDLCREAFSAEHLSWVLQYTKNR